MKATAETTATLPEGYAPLVRIDLKENKRQFWLVNGLSLMVTLVLLVPMVCLIPFSALYEGGAIMALVRLLIMVILLVAYVVLHEMVHGIFMKRFSGVKPHFGISLSYAYAGSDAYFNRRHYIFIALAPVVLWGAVLAIVTPLVPRAWFWVVYFIQIMNLSGAAGDMYVTVRMLRLPADILVQDSGVAMTVFSRTSHE